MYSENLISIKLNTPVRRVEKPFFIGFAILDMSKHIIYHFYYNMLKNTFDMWNCWDRTQIRSLCN